MLRRTLLAGALALTLSSCATWGPTWAEVSGARYYNRTELHTAPTVVNSIDGQNPGPTIDYGRTYKLTPGRHTLVLGAPAISNGWVGGTGPQTLTLDVQPCQRAYIVAKYPNPLGRDWIPQVDYVEPIAGCQVATASK